MRPNTTIALLASFLLASLAPTSTAFPNIEHEAIRPANDGVTGAQQLGMGTSLSGTTWGATYTTNEGECAGRLGGGATLWFFIEVPVQPDWTHHFSVNTIGSTFDTFLGLYQWDTVSPYAILPDDCNDDDSRLDKPKGLGFESRVIVQGSPYSPRYYLIELGGIGGEAGTFQLNYEVEPTESGVPGPVPLPEDVACIPYYEEAYTNVCIAFGVGSNEVPTPGGGEPMEVCPVGTYCVDVPAGWGSTTVPTPWASGYVEATVLCDPVGLCRVEIPDWYLVLPVG